MPKAKSKKQPKTHPVAKRREKQPVAAKRSESPSARTQSKQAKVIELLSQPKGTTVTTIMKITGWQQHSVHGFLSGVVRKKLKLGLDANNTDGETVYRIAEVGAKSKRKAENKIDQAA